MNCSDGLVVAIKQGCKNSSNKGINSNSNYSTKKAISYQIKSLYL